MDSEISLKLKNKGKHKIIAYFAFTGTFQCKTLIVKHGLLVG